MKGRGEEEEWMVLHKTTLPHIEINQKCFTRLLLTSSLLLYKTDMPAKIRRRSSYIKKLLEKKRSKLAKIIWRAGFMEMHRIDSKTVAPM